MAPGDRDLANHGKAPMQKPEHLGIVTSGLLRSMSNDRAWFEAFLQPANLASTLSEIDGVLCWGLKPSAARAAAFARQQGLPLIRMEDAFLRSVKFGTRERPLGMVLDHVGMYYDASHSSHLEQLIATPLQGAEAERSRSIAALWRDGRVSKYNHARESRSQFSDEYVLVIDQTAGDLSLVYGSADAESFQRMLESALEENSSAKVLLKTHPEVLAGRKRGHFDLEQLRKEKRIVILGDDVHPVGLLEKAQRVYTVTSQVGFEALIWGKPVRTFGMPFYAGWGLTTDDLPPPPRRSAASMEQLVHAALVSYARYVHPETKERCEVEDIIAHLALQRQYVERWPREITALGFSRWKHAHVRRFFPYSQVCFRKDQEKMGKAASAATAVWSRPKARPSASPVISLEDGFIRSVGLASDLVPALSWVADCSGIYFDPSSPSDLEQLLQTAAFSSSLLQRAAALRQGILGAEVTKYNWGSEQWVRPAAACGKKVILVPGQVEKDASISLGSPNVRSNFELLRKTRESQPQAFLVYKPHPEVVAGRQSCGLHEAECGDIADNVVTRVHTGHLLSAVDEVHTMTSLAGFEALLRGKDVTTHGQPFYAGWGLTADLLPPQRRSRSLSLDELVAGALILYPLYISQTSGRYTTPERALEELSQWHNIPKPATNVLSKLRRAITDLARPSHPFH
jgi:capsular polysaccharide export protein